MRISGSLLTLFNRTMALLFLSALAYPVQAQLVVDDTPTPTQLVQNVLLGNGVIASNITFTGSLNAIGSFDGTASQPRKITTVALISLAVFSRLLAFGGLVLLALQLQSPQNRRAGHRMSRERR